MIFVRNLHCNREKYDWKQKVKSHNKSNHMGNAESIVFLFSSIPLFFATLNIITMCYVCIHLKHLLECLVSYTRFAEHFDYFLSERTALSLYGH